MERKNILITNDDGIHAEGLVSLEALLSEIGNCKTVAPATQMSGVSQSITLHDPVRLEEHGPNRYAIRTGTPTDCVFVAISHLYEKKPDLVVSGINYGVNVASDVVYSGTVAGAREGVLQGIPGIAISMESGENWDPSHGFPFLKTIIEHHMANERLHGAILNINIPHPKRGPIQGIRTTSLGSRRFENTVAVCEDPRGQEYLWVGGSVAAIHAPKGSDCAALQDAYISVTAVAPFAEDKKAAAELPDGEWPA